MRNAIWSWVGIVLDLILLLPASYMAVAAISIAVQNSSSVIAITIAVLFFVLPVFCIAAPLAAWRSRKRRRSNMYIAMLLAAPWVYAVFLVIFLYNV